MGWMATRKEDTVGGSSETARDLILLRFRRGDGLGFRFRFQRLLNPTNENQCNGLIWDHLTEAGNAVPMIEPVIRVRDNVNIYHCHLEHGTLDCAHNGFGT